MLMVPRVTMNGCRFSPTISTPLIVPHNKPVPSDTSAANGRISQAGALTEKCWSAAAVPSAQSAIVLPTEMSMPPVMMTSVMPTAMMA